jgi:hypothetical protein
MPRVIEKLHWIGFCGMARLLGSRHAASMQTPGAQKLSLLANQVVLY